VFAGHGFLAAHRSHPGHQKFGGPHAEVIALQAAGAQVLFPSVTALDDWFKEKLHEPESLDSFSRSE